MKVKVRIEVEEEDHSIEWNVGYIIYGMIAATLTLAGEKLKLYAGPSKGDLSLVINGKEIDQERLMI